MSRTIGTVARGVRAPIFRQGDDVVSITADTVANALAEEGIAPRDKDVVAITESVVARCQGNYATVRQIAADVRAKTGGKTVGVTFPILSIVIAFANLFGTGGAPLFSIARGRGDDAHAADIMGNTFTMLLGTGLVLTALVLAFKKPLLYLFGASDATFPYLSLIHI